MNEFLELPTGEIVRMDTIVAVRKGDYHDFQMETLTPRPWRVEVDYGVYHRTNRYVFWGGDLDDSGGLKTIEIACDSKESRDQLVETIKATIDQYQITQIVIDPRGIKQPDEQPVT